MPGIPGGRAGKPGGIPGGAAGSAPRNKNISFARFAMKEVRPRHRPPGEHKRKQSFNRD